MPGIGITEGLIDEIARQVAADYDMGLWPPGASGEQVIQTELLKRVGHVRWNQLVAADEVNDTVVAIGNRLRQVGSGAGPDTPPQRVAIGRLPEIDYVVVPNPNGVQGLYNVVSWRRVITYGDGQSPDPVVEGWVDELFYNVTLDNLRNGIGTQFGGARARNIEVQGAYVPVPRPNQWTDADAPPSPGPQGPYSPPGGGTIDRPVAPDASLPTAGPNDGGVNGVPNVTTRCAPGIPGMFNTLECRPLTPASDTVAGVKNGVGGAGGVPSDAANPRLAADLLQKLFLGVAVAVLAALVIAAMRRR